MPSIYDSKCPVCREGMKKLKVRQYLDYPHNSAVINIRTEGWGYAPGQNEIVEEAFCPECGVKFILG